MEKDYKEALFELRLIENKLGKPLTDEQRDFAVDFTRDIITFANPGTGKTHTLTAGIMMAQEYWKTDPTKIFCMSYTKAATNEIKGRYKVLAKKLRASTMVEFGTFHSLANKILASSYQRMEVIHDHDPNEAVADISAYIQKAAPEFAFDNKKAWRIIQTINELNAAFIFDDENVQTKFSFKKLGMPIEQFQEVRRKWFERGLINSQIVQGDIPLYCLYALLRKPEAAALWKGKYEIMIVDEFQDLSMLDLEILTRVAKKLIVVGDMKQQIYVFSGACPEIVDAYKKARPDAYECHLTQSFRCPQAIADLATKVIQPNLDEESIFIGRDGGIATADQCIQTVDRRNIDWSVAFANTNNDTLNDILILYRNNASTIPVIDELYTKGIPYRCPKFVRVTEIPVIKTLCTLAQAAWQPRSVEAAEKALQIFPEFRFQRYNITTYTNIMRTSNKTIFDIGNLLEQASSKQIIDAMRECNQRIKDKKSAGNVLVALQTVYDKWFKPNEYYPNDDRYYYNMVAGICNRMTYPEMVAREDQKYNRHLECLNADMGVRCYTMHSSKGLEAKTVYMLDVNEGIFPNSTQIAKKYEASCAYDASLDVRSERNLLYVAITRARENLIISFSNNTLATLMSDPEHNLYRQYDEIYKEEHKLYDDIAGFDRVLISKKEAPAGSGAPQVILPDNSIMDLQ